jgi:hypothetical protein
MSILNNSSEIPKSLDITVIQKLSRNEVIKNYVNNKFKNLKNFKTPNIKSLKPLEPITINSLSESYITNKNTEGYVKKVKPYITKWN